MKPIYTQEIDWKGEKFVNELYLTPIIPNEKIKQVQAICVTKDKKLVIYENKEGFFGIPGGKLEDDENIEQALKREIYEETASKMESFKTIGYVKSFKSDNQNEYTLNIRCMAIVIPLDEEINDPAGKAIQRFILSPIEAKDKLNWGEMAEHLINEALKSI